MATEVKVSVLPDCDFCKQRGHSHAAHYDGATVLGPWANMCEEDFVLFGRGLGLGVGQRLVLTED